MIVTTAERPTAKLVDQALRLSDELQAPYVARDRLTLSALHKQYDEVEVIVVGQRDVRLIVQGRQPFYYHPSMALIRLKRIRTGGDDALLSVSGVAEGDTVLDCTAGLCADSLVFSYAAGEQGTVIAIEAVRVVHAIVREGLQRYETGLPDIDEAMRRIRTVCGHHGEVLARMEDNSADIVYFDPMFEQPVTTSSSIVPLRTQACREPLSKEAVQHALRIARKKIILKDHRDSGQFARYGFQLARTSGSKVAYGVINIE